MNELQAGIEQSLKILPQSPVPLQPGKAALDKPAFGHPLKEAKLASLSRHVPAQNFLHALRKRLSCITAIAQQTFYTVQSRFAMLERH